MWYVQRPPDFKSCTRMRTRKLLQYKLKKTFLFTGMEATCSVTYSSYVWNWSCDLWPHWDVFSKTFTSSGQSAVTDCPIIIITTTNIIIITIFTKVWCHYTFVFHVAGGVMATDGVTHCRDSVNQNSLCADSSYEEHVTRASSGDVWPWLQSSFDNAYDRIRGVLYPKISHDCLPRG